MKKIIIIIILLNITFLLNAQILKEAFPFIQNYSALEYKALSQNWDFIQDERGMLYVANGDGILEFDGTNWRLMKISNLSAIKSLAKNKNETIFVGAKAEFGFLKSDSIGNLNYESLVNKVPEENHDFESVWKIFTLEDTLFVVTRKYLFYIDLEKDENFKVIETEKLYHTSFLVNNKLYIRENKVGLKVFSNDSLIFVQGGEKLSNTFVFGMLPQPDGKILIASRYEGFYYYNPKAAIADSAITIFDNKLSKLFAENNLYKSVQLSDGRYVFATLSNGVIICDENLNILQIINKEKGLTDDIILSIYEDYEHNIWLGTGDGISFLNTNSPFTVFDHKHNLNSVVYTSYFDNNILFAGGASGFYYKTIGQNFKIYDVLDAQTWYINKIDSTIFCGNRYGFYSLLDSIIKPTNINNNVWNFKKIPGTNYLLIGTHDNALVLFEKQNEKWTFKNTLKGYDYSSRFFEIDKNKNVWITQENEGIFKLEIDYENDTITKITLYNDSLGLPQNNTNYVFKVNENEIIAATEEGIYQYNSKIDKFELAKQYSNILGEKEADLFVQDEEKNIWFQQAATEGYFKGYLTKQEDGTYKVISKPFKKFQEVYNENYSFTEGYTFFNTGLGLIIYDKNYEIDYEKKFNILIRQVFINDSLVYNGAKNKENSKEKVFRYKENGIKFNYSAIFYEESKKTLYSYKLENFDKEWSEWSLKTEKEYTNLPEGEYTFNVKAKNIYETESTIAVYKFEILPPWYRTVWAYIAYVIFTILIVWLIVRLNTYRLTKDKQRLEKIVKERTAEITKQKENILQKNVVLEQQKEEINTQAESLLETNDRLIQKSEEINQQNEEITAQAENLEQINIELTTHKEEIEKSHKNITSSINYARRIQNAMLPNRKILEKNFAAHFVFYLPRDIVSGDFYWFKTVNQYQIIAVADCTGHGVPGAFVSMLGISLLNEIVRRKEITRASQVLDQIRGHIKNSLQQTGKTDEQKDGMDIALCVINSKTKFLQFAGANNSLILITNNELRIENENSKILKYQKTRTDLSHLNENRKILTTIKPDKQPIGIHIREKSFTNHEIELNENDILYMFSDGFSDQFGKDKKQKFLISNFRKLLISISEKPMNEQEKILSKTFDEWKGNSKQLDDVLVMGVKI